MGYFCLKGSQISSEKKEKRKKKKIVKGSAQPFTNGVFYFSSMFARYFGFSYLMGYLCLKGSQISSEKKEKRIKNHS